MNLNDRTVLLTGATGGIGTELSQRLEQQGAKLVLNCINEQQLQRLQTQLKNPHRLVPADISSEEGRQTLAGACADSGGVDVVINLAGILSFGLFEEMSADTIEKMLTVNLIAPMLLCHALLPQLRQRSDAQIVNVGSTFGSIGYPGFVGYCASKAGIRCFSEALCRELADTGINVSYIAPRATNTSLNDDRINAMNSELGNKSDSPAYVANAILSLFTSRKRVRFLGWPEKLFVRVNAVLPSLVSSSLQKQLPVIKHYASQKGV